MTTASSPTPSPDVDLFALEVRRVHRRTRAVLMSGQVLAGLGMGATLSAGALLAAEISGDEAFSGMAATFTTIGAALAAIPLAALARARGRRISLTTGAALAALGGATGLLAAVLAAFPVLLLAFALVGVGTAVNLQSRFAATDLSDPRRRGRDLSLVVWATTVGAVAGPNLISVANDLGVAIGLPELSGPFLFTLAAQALAAVLYTVVLRPDPLRLAERVRLAAAATGVPVAGRADRSGVVAGLVALALSHASMVAVMAMTPVHLTQHGADLVVVGVTISLHIAGMYALSPLFGLLTDRIGQVATVVVGQLLLLASLLVTSFGAEHTPAVMVGLTLLGLGWSASTVAGSALVSASAAPERRTVIQGRADLVMTGAGAFGGASAGGVLALLGYSGLALATVTLVAIVLATLVVRRLGAGTSAVADG